VPLAGYLGAFYREQQRRPLMPTLLKIIGGIWALVGLGNILVMPWNDSSYTVLILGLIFNMVLFVIPGLILFGLGAAIARRRAVSHHTPATVRAEQPDLRTRLETLKELHDSGHLAENEYEHRRAAMLRDV
jgi:hypothetical protein